MEPGKADLLKPTHCDNCKTTHAINGGMEEFDSNFDPDEADFIGYLNNQRQASMMLVSTSTQINVETNSIIELLWENRQSKITRLALNSHLP